MSAIVVAYVKVMGLGWMPTYITSSTLPGTIWQDFLLPILYSLYIMHFSRSIYLTYSGELIFFSHAWLLYLYAGLALRENILRVNGSDIRPWHLSSNYKYTLTINKKSSKFAYRKRVKLPEILQLEYCSICLLEFAEEDEVRELVDCKHAFHKHCLDIKTVGLRRSWLSSC